MWQVEQPKLLKKIFPLAGSPGTVMFLGGVNDRKYAMILRISESSNPFAGISVPDTPWEIVRKISSSVPPCIHLPEVRSGPRPPPRAFSPWQGEQLARNKEDPSLIAAAFAWGVCFVGS
jgi:hypothetical protein